MRIVVTHGSCTDTIKLRLRELALEVDWEKNPSAATLGTHPCQYCACLFSQTLSQLSYSHPFATVTALFCVHCSVCVTYATAFVMVDWAVYCIDQHYTPSDDQILRMTSDIMLQHHSACNLCHFVTVCQCHCWLGSICEWPTLYTCCRCSCPCEVLRAHLEMKC